MSDIQKDLVLSINEYAYVLDKTKGNVSCWVGPIKTSLSTSDELVRFNERTKRFESCGYDEAIHLFATAPKNWYIVLKNPVKDDKHPTPGTVNNLPEGFQVGSKINITGPVSFALYPGQMCKVIQGHSLKINQYLLARVYDADSANESLPIAFDQDGNPIQNEDTKKYTSGQLLIIKGTDVSFYIPPTGIEVIYDKVNCSYIRNAVTLERLEYCILKNENGQKRYEHGPKVVFPEPTEVFVESKHCGNIFKAIELSPISGIYVKVIAPYDDEKGVKHQAGEEMFLTGNDQMIYYPRPEHAIISYDGKYVHHAIAIPKGEGRYIMNRLDGEIKMVVGPAMYLPDPRKEVVVKRKLTKRECELWYPGNRDALSYNECLSESAVEKMVSRMPSTISYNTVDAANMDFLAATSSISRGTSYTKPRTVTLDTKYDGVVSINVWEGYAVRILSKTGESRIVTGPQTILLEYDETLGVVNEHEEYGITETVYLPYKSDDSVPIYVNALTKDFVGVRIDCDLILTFNEEEQDKWFTIKDYKEYLRAQVRNLLAQVISTYTAEELVDNLNTILEENLLQYKCVENGTEIKNFFLNSFNFGDNEVNNILLKNKKLLVSKKSNLNTSLETLEITRKIEEINNEIREIEHNSKMTAIEREKEYNEQQAQIEKEKLLHEQDLEKAKYDAQFNLIDIKDSINKADIARQEETNNSAIECLRKKNELEIEKERSYSENIVNIISSISPDLSAALTHRSNEEILTAIANAVSPYAMANEESVAKTVSTLLRGTGLENILNNVGNLTKNN